MTIRCRPRCCSTARTWTVTPMISAATIDCRSSSTATRRSTDPAAWTPVADPSAPAELGEQLQDGVVRPGLGCDRRRDVEGRSAVQEVRVRHDLAGSARTARPRTSEGRILTAIACARRSPAISELARISGNLNVPGGTPHAAGSFRTSTRRPQLFGLYDRSQFPLGIEPALGNNYNIEEEDTGGYVQADFKTECARIGRCAPTWACATSRPNKHRRATQRTSGSPLLTTVERTYDDTLPSLNVALDVTDQFVDPRFGCQGDGASERRRSERRAWAFWRRARPSVSTAPTRQ